MATTATRVQSPRSKVRPTWAHLFMSLFYAATFLLLLAWFADLKLAAPPGVLTTLVHSSWGWAATAGGGIIVSIIFKDEIGWPVLFWTMFLIIVLGPVAYLLRLHPPVIPGPSPNPVRAAEWWVEVESNQLPAKNWRVQFDGTEFDCPPRLSDTPGAYQCRAISLGNYVAISRFAAGDANTCTFFGVFNGAGFSGQYHCANGGPRPWYADIKK